MIFINQNNSLMVEKHDTLMRQTTHGWRVAEMRTWGKSYNTDAALQFYLWRTWRAAAEWWGRAPVPPWAGTACWSRSAQSRASSRGQTPDTERRCTGPSERRELQKPSLLPQLRKTSCVSVHIRSLWPSQFSPLISSPPNQGPPLWSDLAS